MSAAGIISCACSVTCGQCCFQVTFSGLSFVTTALYAEVDQFFDFDSTVQTGADQGTLNGTFIICDNNPIPYALRVEYTENGNDVGSGDFNACGYVYVEAVYNPFTQTIGVVVRIPLVSVPNEEDEIFTADVSLSAEQIAIIEGAATCEGFGTAESDNTLEISTLYPFNNGSGTVTIGLVPTCDGANPPFIVSCDTTPTGFVQTICDDEDCPCGRTDAQPTCLQASIPGSDATPSVYQNGGVLIDGPGGRNFEISTTTYLKSDGTRVKFMVVVDDPDAPTIGEDGAYFEHPCAGDLLDNYSGTWTYIDPADYSGATFTLLNTHQTALANIGTTIHAWDCYCRAAADEYTLSIQCDVGTSPADWDGDLTLARVGDACLWQVTGVSHYAQLIYDGEWHLTVNQVSDDALAMSADWAGSGDDPTGTHGFAGADTGWDEECSALSAIISTGSPPMAPLFFGGMDSEEPGSGSDLILDMLFALGA